MKRIILVITMMLPSLLSFAQSSDHNYIKVVTTSDFSGGNRSKVVYYDELGREEQSAIVGGVPSGGSIVTGTDYDAYGRVSRQWLHGAVSGNTTGTYTDKNLLANNASVSNDNDSKPYSLSLYEQSPLNRPTQQYGPGASWQSDASHSFRTEYLLNISGDAALNCIKYTATITASTEGISASVTNHGNWATGSLAVLKTKDEDGLELYTFKDRNGEVVLSRQLTSTGGNHVCYDTYYIRDEWGNLLAVLPPLAADQTKNAGTYSSAHTAIDGYAYLYCLDRRFRQTAKKLPGCAWTYIVYDKSDMPILTQDGNQRSSNEWTVCVPDAWGRTCVEGTITSTSYNPTSSIGNYVNAYRTGSASYLITGLNFNFDNRLTEFYYDDYEFIGSNGFPASLAYEADGDYGTRETARPVGLQTGVKSILLDNGANASFLYKAAYYDYHKKVIQSRATNHLGGTETGWTLYDLLGRMTKSKHTHTATGQTVRTQYDVYTYDGWDRLLTHTHQIGDAEPVMIANNTYDGTGRLLSNSRNGVAGLTSSYSYNVRSWQKTVINTSFQQSLYYNTQRSGAVTPACWGGNISSMEWRHNGVSYYYDFQYDKLHRLTGAIYADDSGDGYEEAFSTYYGYDKNGNINSIMRQAVTIDYEVAPLDEMQLHYSGNRLQSITDYVDHEFEFYTPYPVSQSNNAYAYDQNGNTTKDLDRNISLIQYNRLNLPRRITYTDGSTATYTYNSLGEKLLVSYGTALLTASQPASSLTEQAVRQDAARIASLNLSSTTVNYCGNIVYNGSNISRILLGGEGYCTLSGNTPTYYFYIKDYLGNTRAVVQQNGTRRQFSQYYPYGKRWEGNNFQPYLYNGKELDQMHGLEWYDYGARMYESGIGRFMTMDPLCEKYYNISPYAYCGNDPVNRTDPDGKDWYSSLDSIGSDGGQTIWQTQIHYTDYTSQEQMDNHKINGTYMGETVVLFDGFYDEKLGTNNTLDGPSSKHAIAIVYGANGADDITSYTAYTMTSDFEKYGAIQDGIYDGTYAGNNKPNHIPKPYVLNKGGAINTIDGNRYKDGYSKNQKSGIFIHRTNNNGTANGTVSVGCLLVKAQQMENFERHVGRKPFKVILRRK